MFRSYFRLTFPGAARSIKTKDLFGIAGRENELSVPLFLHSRHMPFSVNIIPNRVFAVVIL